MPLRQYAARRPGHLDRNVFIRIINTHLTLRRKRYEAMYGFG